MKTHLNLSSGKFLKSRFFSFCLFFLLSTGAYAVPVIGETSPLRGGTYTYSCTKSTAFSTTTTVWSAFGGGTIVSTNLSPDKLTAYATITWTQAEEWPISVKSAGVTVGNGGVYVYCAFAPTSYSITHGGTPGNLACGQTVFVINASSGNGGDQLKYYTTSSGGTAVATGPGYTTPLLSSSTSYFISSYNSTYNCESPTRLQINLTIDTKPSVPSVTPAERCGDGQLVLSASPGAGGDQVAWNDEIDLGTSLTLTTSVLSASHYYNAQTINSSTGCRSDEVQVLAKINLVPSAPGVNGATLCGSGSVGLSGSAGANATTLRWYDVSAEGSVLTENLTFSTPSLSATTTFYASSYHSTTKCESTRVPVLATIYTQPSVPTASVLIGDTPAPGGSCGSSAFTILATKGANSDNVNWYTDSNPQTAPFRQNSSYITPSPLSATTTFYLTSVTTSTGCESVPRQAITAIVRPLLATPTIVSSSVSTCAGVPVVLSATPPAGSSLQWTDGAAQIVSSATSWPVTLQDHAIYNVMSIASGQCSSVPVQVAVTVNKKPKPPRDYTNTDAYGSGTVTLVASVPSNHQVDWYSNAQATNYITSAPAYTTPVISTTTNYYARAKDLSTLCVSDPGTIVAVVNPVIAPLSVKQESIRVSGVKTDVAINALTTAEKSIRISYLDGLARVNQTIDVNSSPLGRNSVQPFVYDAQGNAAKQYLPYVTTSSLPADTLFQSAYATSQASFYSASGDKIIDDGSPYAMTVYENSPLGRVKEQGITGDSWQPGTTHTTRLVYSYNTGATASVLEEVRNFKADGTSSGFYIANKLSRTQSTDADGKVQVIYQDTRGNTLAKKQQLDQTIAGTMVNWLETYYIYDDMDRIKYILSPKGVVALKANAWTLSAAILDNYAQQFVYDTRGRVVEKKTPGQAWNYVVYDKLNRVVLAQDGLLRAANKWSFIKYDQRGRSVMQGIYLNTTQTTRAAVQVIADELYTAANVTYPASAWYESRGTVLHGYSNTSFPKTNANGTALEVWSVNYYDTYDFDYNGTDEYSYAVQSLPNENTPAVFTNGFATGNKRIVLGTATWMYSYAFYDDKGRVLQVRSSNHLSSTADNLVTNVFDFEGKLKTSKKYHHAAGSNITTVINKFNYDTNGRLLQVYQNNNSAPADQLVVQYAYNELGQMVDKKLHNTTGNTFLQSVDYRYTLHGRLLSINNAQLTADASNDDTDDYFGMEYLYNLTESALGNVALYNDNVSAVKWKGAGSTSGATDQKSYKYTYDKANQLIGATSQMYSGTWTKEAGAQNESMSYDHNGNISALQRNQRKHQLSGLIASYTSESVDNLTYTYNATTGDRLDKVTDAATPLIAGGFSNGNSGTSTDYTYDVNGNVLSDLNKGISAITYNLQGKASQVTFSDGRVINYVYDGAGNKLSMSVTKSGTTTTTHYADGFVYEGTVLSFFGSPEGRVVNKGGSLEYQYSIADHQGNTRVVFSGAPVIAESKTANMEGSTNADFQNYTSRVSFDLMDHTDAAGTLYTYSQKIMGAKAGLAKSMKVYPGDKVKIEGYAKYYNAQATSTNLTAFAGTLLTAFGLPVPVGGEIGTAASAVNSWGSIVAAGGGNGNSTYPKLFVNILVFDKNYNFLDIAFEQVNGGEQVGVVTKAPHDYMSREYTAKEEGYVFMYFSNESPTQVEFYVDDVSTTYTPTNIVQYNEYYPFGLQASTSWTRDNNSNNFLYNEGSELNANTGWYETMFRGYDPALGRFMQVDLLADVDHSTSPFAYAGNNPISFNDPSGLLKTTQDIFDVANDLWDQPYGGNWHDDGTENGDYDYFSSESDGAFWALNNWGYVGGGNTSANAEGQLANIAAGGGIELREAVITIDSDYGYFKGEPYYSQLWLQYRIDEKFIDYRAWRSKQTDQLQSVFSNIGLIPILGEVFDGVNAGIYALRGNYGAAALSAAAVLPIAGYAASLLKFQKHHVIPNAVFKDFAARLNSIGWVQDASLNLKKLPVPFHGNHPAYNDYVTSRINELIRTGSFNYSNMSALQHELRQQINQVYSLGVGNLNDFYKGLVR